MTKNQPLDDSRARIMRVVLRLGSLLCFAGWAWVHYYWEGPYGVLLWDDQTFELAERFGISWEEFVGTGYNDGLVQRWLARSFWVLAICAILSITVHRRARVQMAFLVVAGGGLLLLLSYAKYVAALRQPPMLIEHGGQFLMPLLLVLAVGWGVRHRATVIVAMVALVMTFVGHGSYALGLWPTPGTYFGMTSVILGTDEATSTLLLRIAGVADMAACVGIFIPFLRRSAALYATIWGFLTAIARPVAGMSWGLNYWGADQYVHEAVLRAPHYMIPLYLFILWGSSQTPPEELPSSAAEID